MSVTETQNYSYATGKGSSDQTISYTTVATGGGTHTVDTSTDKKISAYGPISSRGCAIYVGFTVSVTVPAWTKYDIDFPFEMAAVKVNHASSPGTVCRTRAELLYYGRPTDTDPTLYTAANGDSNGPVTFSQTYVASNAGYNGSPTTGTNVTSKLLIVQANNTTGNSASKYNPKKDTVTVEDTYENRSDNPATVSYSFGFFINQPINVTGAVMSVGYEGCPSYLQLKPCTAEVEDLWVDAPSAVSTTYTGTAYTTNTLNQISDITGAKWYDANLMNLSLQEAEAKDAGTYNVDVSLKAAGTTDDPWKLSDGTFSHDPQTITLTINKATPVVSFGNASTTDQYTVSGSQDEFPTPTVTYNNATVPGTISWGSQTPKGSATGNRQTYSYTFTPDDTTNYNAVNSTVSLNYITPGIESVSATFNSNGATVYKSTPTATLNGYFTVMVKYAGITEPKENNSFTILGWDS
ncbi:MAG: hypothetical protein K2G26_05330, partial [Clostridia bacterium]|nr:hypothetical protein [Clostridia bacterium]